MSTKVIPEHYLNKMSAEDRKGLGKAGYTRSEINHLQEKKTERQIHDDIERYLNRNGIPYDHSRMDKRPTNKVGDPDFKIYMCNRVLFLEVKTPTGKLSKDQQDRIEKLVSKGNSVAVCYSYDSARETIENFFPNLI